MDKRKLASELAEKAGIKKGDASTIVDLMFDILRENLEKGEKIIIHGFGSFIVRDFSPRMGVHPVTLEKMEIEASKKVKFNQSKSIKLK